MDNKPKKPKKPSGIAKPSGPRMPNPAEVGDSPVGTAVPVKPQATMEWHDAGCMCASCKGVYPMPKM